MNKIKIILTLGFIGLIAAVCIQQKRISNIKSERDRYASNNNSLLSDIRQWKVDSTTMATDARSLRLTIQELKEHRAEDLGKIKAMGVKIKDLEAVAKHSLSVKAPIAVPIRDTLILRELMPIPAKHVKITNPHLSMDATIIKDSLVGNISLPVTIQQAIWIEYKRCWIFWKKVIGGSSNYIIR